VAKLLTMLEHDRKQAGCSMGQVAWRHGVSIREYPELGVGAWALSDDRWRSV
jgi:hypothetical protein